MFGIPLEIIAFLGIIIGAIGRTVFPFLKKLDPNDQTPITFNVRFWMTATISGIIAAIFIYPTFVVPETGSVFELFLAAFLAAWAADDILNRLVNNNTTPVKNEEIKTPTTTVVATPIMKFAPEKP